MSFPNETVILIIWYFNTCGVYRAKYSCILLLSDTKSQNRESKTQTDQKIKCNNDIHMHINTYICIKFLITMNRLYFAMFLVEVR